MLNSPCAITAVGIVTTLGIDVDETWTRLIAGDQSRLSVRDDLVPGRSMLVGAVREPLRDVPPALARYACRNNALSMTAVAPVEARMRAAIQRYGPRRVGVVMGSTTSGIAAAEMAVETAQVEGRLPASFDLVQMELGGAAEFLATWLGVSGPAYTISTACSSGSKAVAAARSLLAMGVCDAVVAGGTDSLCRLTTNGFTALQAVADEPSNPFSAKRAGLTLGEGSAIFLLEPRADGIQVLGVGETSDGFHISAPEPEGLGPETAIREALADAGLAPDDVAYVNLHGTGTSLNDAMEAHVVNRVFGPRMACSSTKPLVGHTLGAAGAVELAFCWMVLARREGASLALPPHCWDGAADPELPPLRLVAKGDRVEAGATTAVLSNSFGFGGNNSVVVLGTRR